MYKLLVLLLLLVISGCDVGGKTDVEYAAKAEQLFYDGDIDGAVIQLKNALEIDAKNGSARWLLAKIYIEAGDGVSAEKELGRARQYGTGDNEIVPLMAKAYLLQRRYSDVLELEIAPSFSAQAKSDLLAAYAIAHLNNRDLEKASDNAKKAVELTPDSSYALVALARVQVAENHREEAYENLSKVFSLNDKYAPAWGFYGDLKRDDNELEDALQAYTKAIQGYAGKGNNLYKRARVYISLNRLDDAEKDIASLKKINPKHFRVNYLQGLVLFLRGKYDEALEPLQKAVTENGGFAEALFYMGATQHILGNNLQAQEYAERLYALTPNAVAARKLLAQVKLKAQNYPVAEELLLPIVEQRPNDSLARQLLAETYMRQNKTAEAVELLKQLSEKFPESADISTRLGVSLLREGNEEAGFAALAEAIQKDPTYQQAEVALILYHMSKKDFDQALAASKEFIKRDDKNVIAHNLLAQSYLMNSMEPEAVIEFQKVREMERGNKLANSELARIAIREKQFDQAKKYFREILDVHKRDLTTFLRLAAVEKTLNNREAMRRVLDEAIRFNPDALQPRLLSANENLLEGRADRALTDMAPIREKHASVPAVMTVLGRIYFANGDYSQARHFFTNLVGVAPKSAAANFFLAQTYAGLNDEVNLEKYLHQVLQLDEKHFPARVALARLYLKQGKIADVKQQYEKLLHISDSSNVDICMLHANLLYADGDKAEALSILQNLYRESPNKQSMQEYTRMLWEKGDQQAAVRNMEDWLSRNNDIDVRFELATALKTLGDTAGSIKQYRQILAMSPDNPIALNNLALALQKTDPEQALKLAEQAYRASENSVAIMDTLAGILMERGDLVRALRLNQRAMDKLPGQAALLYQSAQINSRMGKKAEALSALEALLSQENISVLDRKRAEDLRNSL